MNKKFIVVGGGFSGLITAFYLKRHGWNVEVYEKSAQPGGLISSEQTEWGLVEAAANGVINSARVEELFRELSVEVMPTRKEARKRYIFRQRLRQWPLSWNESRKVLFDFLPRFLVWRRSVKPMPLETLASWGERTMGTEATQYILGPAFSGIYAGDVARMSATLALARFFKKRERQRKPRMRGTVTPIKGMGHLLEQLTLFLQREKVTFHFGREFDWSAVKKSNVPVVICTSADQAARILQSRAPQVAQALQKIEMLPLVSVAVFYEKSGQDLPGFGCLFPRSEGFDVLGVLFNEQIFNERGDYRSERWIFGGAHRTNVCDWSDDYILSKVKVERMRIFGRSDKPIGYRIHRWPRALPHYTIELETALEKLEKPPGHIFLMGNYLGEIGLSQIVDRAYHFAERMNDLDEAPSHTDTHDASPEASA